MPESQILSHVVLVTSLHVHSDRVETIIDALRSLDTHRFTKHLFDDVNSKSESEFAAIPSHLSLWSKHNL